MYSGSHARTVHEGQGVYNMSEIPFEVQQLGGSAGAWMKAGWSVEGEPDGVGSQRGQEWKRDCRQQV